MKEWLVRVGDLFLRLDEGCKDRIRPAPLVELARATRYDFRTANRIAREYDMVVVRVEEKV